MNFLKIFLLLVCGASVTYSRAQQPGANQEVKINEDKSEESCRGFCGCDGNSQAPLGVMTDHIHSKGTWMLSYTFMNTSMRGNNIGASKASDNMVYQNYMMAPETMSMQMHMLMAMYGVTNRLTVMAMGGYALSNMSMNMSSAMMNMPGMVMPMGDMTMQSVSSGITDTKLYGLYNFSGRANQRLIGSIGINIPTGTIKATGTTMLGDDQRLPYDMQPGSGSFSLLPGVTYVRKYSFFYWGADAGADIKLNYNSLGYKDGNVFHASAWAGYQFLPFLSGTLRMEDTRTDMISGNDRAIAIPIYQESDPTTKTGNYGGTGMNAYVGLNFYLMKPVMEHFRVMAEYGMPVYQNLNGTQLALKSNFLAGLQYSF